MICIRFEVREMLGLAAGIFGTGRCALLLCSGQAVCRQDHPRANPSHKPLRASIPHSLASVTTRQQYCVVLGRFFGVRVTGGAASLRPLADSHPLRSGGRVFKPVATPGVGTGEGYFSVEGVETAKTRGAKTPRFKRSGQAGTRGPRRFFVNKDDGGRVTFGAS